jgi:hypothetical protein
VGALKGIHFVFGHISDDKPDNSDCKANGWGKYDEFVRALLVAMPMILNVCYNKLYYWALNMKTNSLLCGFLIAIVSTVLTQSFTPAKTSKTSSNREAVSSPDGRYSVVSIPYWIERLDNVHSRHLYLARQNHRQRIPLMLDDTNGFDHFIDVLWSPDSKKFAVNQYDPNLTARAYLYYVNNRETRVDLEDRLKRLIKDKKQKQFFTGITAMGHIIVAEKWLDDQWLELYLEDSKVDKNGNATNECYHLKLPPRDC